MTTTWIRCGVGRALAVALAVVTPAGLLVVSSAPAAAQTGPEGEVDHETFYRELSPYGEWFEHPRWGEVWRPNVESDWRPYTRGHWAWTDEHGWYWVAEEEWGWAPFHYGRWVFDEDEEEWLWIPGTEWAPAWVQWRESENFVGWAPLPPDSMFDGGSLRFSQTTYDSPRYSRYWVFAPPSLIFLPGLYRHIVPTSRHSSVWRSTQHVSFTHRFDRGRIYMPGIDHRRIERWSGRSVPVVSLRPVTSARDYGWRRMQDRTTVPVFRPRVVVRQDAPRPQRPMFGGADRNRDGVPDWRQGDRSRDGRSIVVTPGGRDRNRDGVPDWRQDGRPDWRQDRNRDGIPDWRQGDRRPDVTIERRRDISPPPQPPPRGGQPGILSSGGAADVRRPQEDAARRAQEEAARRAQDAARQQQDAARRAQEDAARRAQDAARQQQDAARRAQEDAARRAQDAARQQQDAARRAQEDAARRAQDASRQQQDAVRRAQEEAARRAQEQAKRQPAAGSGAGQGGGAGAGGADVRRQQGGSGDGRGGGERRRRDGERDEPKKAN